MKEIKMEILHMINHLEKNSKKPLPTDILEKKKELEAMLEKKKQIK